MANLRSNRIQLRSGKILADRSRNRQMDDKRKLKRKKKVKTQGNQSVPINANPSKLVLATKKNHSVAITATHERCSICLVSFNDQEVGVPNTCKHYFCATCIKKWANVVRSCPLDRKSFDHICIRRRFTETQIIRKVALTPNTYSGKYVFQFDNQYRLRKLNINYCAIQ